MLGEGGRGGTEDWAGGSSGGGGGGAWNGGGGAYVVVMVTALEGAATGPNSPYTEVGMFVTVEGISLANRKAVAFDCSGGHVTLIYNPPGFWTANRRLAKSAIGNASGNHAAIIVAPGASALAACCMYGIALHTTIDNMSSC